MKCWYLLTASSARCQLGVIFVSVMCWYHFLLSYSGCVCSDVVHEELPVAL
jgi:hypothetical protein